MAIEPLDSLTRICLARQLSPETWLRLFREAIARNAEGKGDSEASLHDAHTEAIDYVLFTLRNSPAIPLAQSYLQACLVADGPKKHLLNKLLEAAADAEDELMSFSEDKSFFESLAATLLASDAAIISKVQPAKSSQEAYKRVQAVIRLLALAARSQLSSLFVLALQLLQLPLPQQPHDLDSGLKQTLEQDIVSCRNALTSMTENSSTLPYPVEMAHKYLDKLERVLNPLANRRRTFVNPPTFPSMPVEMDVILQSMLYDNCVGAVSKLRGSIAARLVVQRALLGHSEASDREEVLNEWFGDLFRICSSHVTSAEEPKDRAEARWRAFTFGKLPGLLAELQSEPSLSRLGFDLPSAMQKGLQICQERNDAQRRGNEAEWSKAAERYLIKPPEIKSEILDQSPEELVDLLQDGLGHYERQVSAATSMASHISKWTGSSDIPTLQHFLLLLVKQTPRIVDYVLLHQSAEVLFKPICQLLEGWDSVDEYGAGQAMELYGGVLLALRALVRRHYLQEAFTQFGYSVTSSITASSDTLSNPTSLHALSDQHRQLVASWITALYGSEGIEDELIRSTAPRVMLALAPTIVHQSMMAMENGIIDQETLLNGLSYFCQDFLTFALPAIISYLALRPQPSLQLINPLLASDSTPACVLELVQDDLKIMLAKANPGEEDVKAMAKRLKSGAAVAPLSLSNSTHALATGSEMVPNLRASRTTADKQTMLELLIGGQDPFMASLLICEQASSLTVQSVKEIVRQAIPRTRSVFDAEEPTEMEKLADLTALTFIRAGYVPDEGDFALWPSLIVSRLKVWKRDYLV